MYTKLGCRFTLIVALLYLALAPAYTQAAAGVGGNEPRGKAPAAAASQPTAALPAAQQPSVPTTTDPAGWHNPSPQLYDIKMTSATSGWVVGESGTILRYNGGQWLNVTSPTLYTLRAVDGNDTEA